MIKKLIKIGVSIFLGTVLFAAGCAAVFAADEQVEYSVMFNGQKLVFDQDPVNVNDRVLVPMRGIFEAYGAEVDWDPDSRVVIAVSGDTEIELAIDSKISYINGKKHILDSPAIIVGDRTMVPVRFVSEALDAKVDWDEDTYTVIISAEIKPDNSKPDEGIGNGAIFKDIDDIIWDTGFFSTQDGIKGACYLTCLGMISSNLNGEKIRASHVYILNRNSVEQHDWYGLLDKLNIVRTDYHNLKGQSAEQKIKIITDLLKKNPEGVIVRFINGSGASHYIVCKGFEDGKLIANDPVGQIYVPLDETWVGYSMFNGYEAAVNGIVLAEAYNKGSGKFSWDFLKEDPKDEEPEGEETE
ncbi:MAG: copper amine oxidase N-terminal domain-containing protein [Bacillota bacterium]|nr:copper amine oxidase N-terminal domain-containing protein [Bacillota bacterium]